MLHKCNKEVKKHPINHHSKKTHTQTNKPHREGKMKDLMTMLTFLLDGMAIAHLIEAMLKKCSTERSRHRKIAQITAVLSIATSFVARNLF